MATWTKVITSADTVAVAQGGTNATSFSDGVVLSNDTGTSGGIYTYALPAGQMLMGTTGGIPTGGASNSSGDVTFSGESSVTFSIGTGKVTGTHVANSTLTWATHVTTDSALDNAIPYYNASGVPLNLPHGNNGQVLGYNGTTLIWVDTGAATTINIGSSSSGDHDLVFATASDAISKDSTTGNLSYNSLTNILTAAGGFVGDLQGVADVAKNVHVADDSGGSTTKKVIFSLSATADATGEDLGSDNGFTYNPGGSGGGTLTVPNLTVSGTTTTLNTSVLQVDDPRVTLGLTNSAQPDANAAALGAGFEVYVTDAAGTALATGLLPKVKYVGGSDVSTISPSGWTIQKYGVDDNNPVVSGIATMDRASGSGAPTVHKGLGAFHMTSAGVLYIQTA